MPELPVVSGATCIMALAKLGYVKSRQKGSHVRLVCAGRSPVTVPMHKELDRGTLRSILRTTDVSIEDFLAALG